MCSKVFLVPGKNALLISCLLFSMFFMPGCNSRSKQNTSRKPLDYIKKIPGKSENIPVEIAQRGEVLIAYSDCNICHKIDKTSAGPAFKDVAQRYPANKVYIEALARKVILGGKGNWGSAVMDPHPGLSFEDAKLMVSYVLSLKNN
jgi:cytochrome c